jgi:hypothetical protein
VQFLSFVTIFVSFSDRFYKNYGFWDEKYGQLERTTGFWRNIRKSSCLKLRTARTRTYLPIYGLSVPYTDKWEPCRYKCGGKSVTMAKCKLKILGKSRILLNFCHIIISLLISRNFDYLSSSHFVCRNFQKNFSFKITSR